MAYIQGFRIFAVISSVLESTTGGAVFYLIGGPKLTFFRCNKFRRGFRKFTSKFRHPLDFNNKIPAPYRKSEIKLVRSFFWSGLGRSGLGCFTVAVENFSLITNISDGTKLEVPKRCFTSRHSVDTQSVLNHFRSSYFLKG